MKGLSSACLLLAGLISIAPVNAQGTLEITWQNPDDYRDIRPTSQTKLSFRKQVFSQLEEYINQHLLDKLSDGIILSMTFTDVDLAGEVWPAMMVGLQGASDVRLIKQIDSPRLAFQYRLTDGSGNVIAEGEENIRDMGFMDRRTVMRDSDSLRYEKQILREWFYQTFKAQLVE